MTEQTENKAAIHRPGLARDPAGAVYGRRPGRRAGRARAAVSREQAKRNLRPDPSLSRAPSRSRPENMSHRANGKTTIVYEARNADGQRRLGPAGQRPGVRRPHRAARRARSRLATITGCLCSTRKRRPAWATTSPMPSGFATSSLANRSISRWSSSNRIPEPEHEILALTGATISSESVSEIVNQTVANLKQAVLQIDHTEKAEDAEPATIGTE